MDETTARSELLGRMPDLHRVFRERTNEIDYAGDWILKIDFLMIAIWMFGDREIVAGHLEKFRGKHVVIRGEGHGEALRTGLFRAIIATNEGHWLECVEDLADHIPHLPEVYRLALFIPCEHTMQLVNMVLDRLNKAVRMVQVGVYGFDPSPGFTEKFIKGLDRSGPLYCLILEGITDRVVFWSKILKYAFRRPRNRGLVLREARDCRLVTSLTSIRCTVTHVSPVILFDCIIDDELFSLLFTMPIRRLVIARSSRIRGNFSTVANALANNTTLKWLSVDCDEVSSSFTEAVLNGIANNVTLEVLKFQSKAVEPFSALCRGVGRNVSIRFAHLPVSTLMDEAFMYELAQSPSLQDLTLGVDPNRRGIFSWSAMASYLRAKRSLKRLKISGCSEGNDPSDDDLRMIGQSLADNSSLETLELEILSDSPRWKGYADFVSGLGCNTTLRSLTLAGRDTHPAGAVFQQAMERNYGLEDVRFIKSNGRLEDFRFIKGDSSPLVDMICKLNAAGRKYLLTDPTSRAKGVDVLSRVITDLNCLYYHLRENPSLCNRSEHRNDIAASPAKSRKRRRCTQSTSEQCVSGRPCE